MLKKTSVIVVAFILAMFASSLPATETSTDKGNEQIKLFEKAIQENPDIATITSWFESPEYLVKRYNAGKKEADAVWRKHQAEIRKIKDLGATQTLEIIPLIDWHTANEKLMGEPSVSYLIKTDKSAILFDVGLNGKQSDPSPLLNNMKLLGVATEDFDTIIISHNHIDHVGGRMWGRQKTFSLGNKQIPLSAKKTLTPIPMTYPGLSPITAENPTKISAGVATTGVIANQFFFGGLTAEQAIAVNVEGKGIVLIVGCGHQSLPKLLERAEGLFDAPVYGLIGGLHYPVTDSRLIIRGVKIQKYFGTGKTPWESLTLEDVRNNINLLKKKNPGIVALSAHDSCDASIEEFRKAFGVKYRDIKVGETIVVGNR